MATVAIIVDDIEALRKERAEYFRQRTTIEKIVECSGTTEVFAAIEAARSGGDRIVVFVSDFDLTEEHEREGRLFVEALQRIGEFQNFNHVAAILTSGRLAHNEEVQEALARAQEIAPTAQFICKTGTDVALEWQFMLVQCRLWKG